MTSMFASKSKWRTAAFWGLLVLALDLSTKALALAKLNPWKPLTVIPGFFDLILTYNTGAAFSIFAADDPVPERQGLKMAVFSAVSLLPFIYFYVKAAYKDRLLLTSLGLIWGGALGNIHDRLRWNAVVDFIDLYLGDKHWPAFNVADMAICLGAGLLALSIIREKPEKPSV